MILVQIMRDAGHEPERWLFEFHNELEQLSVKDLQDVCKTMLETENYEKAAEVRDLIKKKTEKQKDGTKTKISSDTKTDLK
jgi:protein-arginine kinase activator protein McsA